VGVALDGHPLFFVMRVALTLLAIGLCLFLIQASARFGFSRLLTRYALISNSVSVADEVIQLSPADPEAHRARAAILNRLQMPSEAVKSLEDAAKLCYRNDYLWIELGNTKEELGNTAGALAAMDQAVRWAPYYAHTHWQRGNLLLRMGRPDDAFDELRKAAAANQTYFPNLMDLAWGVSRSDVKVAEALIGIKNDSERTAWIRFLLASKAFREAFELWRVSSSAKLESPSIVNGGFEEPFILNETGFGWIVSSQHKNRLAIDVSEKLEGAKSLQINLDGNWPPATPLLSQIVVVKPETTCRLSFSVKTKDLVTGGPPLVTVIDAINGQLLGKSENFPTATSSWTQLSFDFNTLSQAVILRLQRNNCDSSPCPIFGTLWLDQFHIEQTKPAGKQ
jgi:tetratricopeptide (TPR) repeat protein